MTQTPGPAADLIQHAAGVIAAAMKEPHTAPYHWAGALWEAGMLQPPGHGTVVAAVDLRLPGLSAEEIDALRVAALSSALDHGSDDVLRSALDKLTATQHTR